MTTQKEMAETFLATLEGIIKVCDKTTSGNVSHNIATIKGKCRNMLQFYKEFPVSPWHSVADGDLPTLGKYITVLFENTEGKDRVYTGNFHRIDETGWFIMHDLHTAYMHYINNVKYWMEIPQLPNTK